ncbi:MFS transporter [Nocardioides salsibiostraticola]
MISTYRRVLERPGTARFSATGLVARLPISMVGLGIVLLVENATDSYKTAGAVSAVALFSNGLAAIVHGRLLDRLGQARVLAPLITFWGVSLAALIWSVQESLPMGVTYTLAVLAGISLPSVGTCVRARWSHVLDKPDEVQTAFALEAVADEVVFIAGPILVTVLATAVHPAAGLGTALVTGLLGTLILASQRSTEPPPHPRVVVRAHRARMPWGVIAPLALVSACIGVLFGSIEVTTVAFAEEVGSKTYAGPLLALYALGSLAAGVVTGAIGWKSGPLIRLRWGSAAMAVAVAPLYFIDSLLAMGAALLLAGLAIAPTLIASLSLCEQVLPPSRMTEGMTFVHTGIVAGVAPGAAIAGAIIDARGASAAYLVCVVGGILAAGVSLLTPGGSRYAEAHGVPSDRRV